MSTEISKVKCEMHLQQWSAEIQECKESGLTVGKWCSEKGIKPKTYYYHLKQVRDSMIEKYFGIGGSSSFAEPEE